jgi:hypothetical protein
MGSRVTIVHSFLYIPSELAHDFDDDFNECYDLAGVPGGSERGLRS